MDNNRDSKLFVIFQVIFKNKYKKMIKIIYLVFIYQELIEIR